MSSGRINVIRKGKQAEIVIDNPGRRNAISAPMWETLRDFFAEAKDDATLRAVIVRGDGSVFSAGADITGFEQQRSGASAGSYDDLVEFTLRSIEALPQIVIAALAGPCMGAGASLACACDIRVADARGFFKVPAAELGLGYDPRGIRRFVRIFGDCVTRDLLLLGSRITAQRAYDLGAIQYLVNEGEALDVAKTIADRAASLAPLTQKAAKRALQDLAAGTEISQDAREFAAIADASLDYLEGRAAFADKRPANFSGR